MFPISVTIGHMESLVALKELYHMLKWKDANCFPCKIVHLPVQIPGACDDSLNVPIIPPNNVLVNGDKASFADIISSDKNGIRLSQVKFTEDDSVSLNFYSEVEQMGLLKTSSCQSGQLVKYLTNEWSCQMPEQQTTHKVTVTKATDSVKDKKARSMTYPISLHTTAMNEIENNVTRKIQPSDINESKVKSEVHVIFATNASRFHIPKLTIGKKATIEEVTDMSKLINYSLLSIDNLEQKRNKLREHLPDPIPDI